MVLRQMEEPAGGSYQLFPMVSHSSARSRFSSSEKVSMYPDSENGIEFKDGVLDGSAGEPDVSSLIFLVLDSVLLLLAVPPSMSNKVRCLFFDAVTAVSTLTDASLSAVATTWP